VLTREEAGAGKAPWQRFIFHFNISPKKGTPDILFHSGSVHSLKFKTFKPSKRIYMGAGRGFAKSPFCLLMSTPAGGWALPVGRYESTPVGRGEVAPFGPE